LTTKILHDAVPKFYRQLRQHFFESYYEYIRAHPEMRGVVFNMNYPMKTHRKDGLGAHLYFQFAQRSRVLWVRDSENHYPAVLSEYRIVHPYSFERDIPIDCRFSLSLASEKVVPDRLTKDIMKDSIIRIQQDRNFPFSPRNLQICEMLAFDPQMTHKEIVEALPGEGHLNKDKQIIKLNNQTKDITSKAKEHICPLMESANVVAHYLRFLGVIGTREVKAADVFASR
jgi:hypothetical protein